MEKKKEKQEKAKDNKALGVVALGGAGILIYLLLKGKKDIKKGFNIIQWKVPGEAVPQSKIELIFICKNNGSQQIDGFCRVADTEKEIYYDHSLVNPLQFFTFTAITTMPGEEYKIQVTSGNHATQEIHSQINLIIKIPAGKITIDSFTAKQVV